MTQEEKQLLLKDLSARLSYEVRICRNRNGEVCDFTLYGIVGERLVSKATYEEKTYSKGIVSKHFETLLYSKLLNIQCKPYLRPMSSMTKEEAIDLFKTIHGNEKLVSCEIKNDRVTYIFGDVDYHGCVTYFFNRIYGAKQLDWLNEHHFDYRQLIEKGLALEAPEGMYN